ncbi:hypothetical protein ZHAS_00009971 [Anopheles sinensis]|uniref:Uncharacterized protein n=1 Tax=Anopheles sinensis TaxID=74873 RepID=A0A084VWE5_ANOSI|nr:hypothetical protein ZHAS_00009971 [Anopheles sinensis]
MADHGVGSQKDKRCDNDGTSENVTEQDATELVEVKVVSAAFPIPGQPSSLDGRCDRWNRKARG